MACFAGDALWLSCHTNLLTHRVTISLYPGAALRETLKWDSVEKVVMVELDAAVVHAYRNYLPSYSNCTGFGTASCFDDPRVELYTEDFTKWFDSYFGGNNTCEEIQA